MYYFVPLHDLDGLTLLLRPSYCSINRCSAYSANCTRTTMVPYRCSMLDTLMIHVGVVRNILLPPSPFPKAHALYSTVLYHIESIGPQCMCDIYRHRTSETCGTFVHVSPTVTGITNNVMNSSCFRLTIPPLYSLGFHQLPILVCKL